MDQNKEIAYIHLIRVIACFLVVSCHSMANLNFFPPSEFSEKLFVFLSSNVNMSCVPLFFMLTGILILPIKQPDTFSFYQKRIPRVLFPLLFWGIVYSLLPYLLGLYDCGTMWKELLLVPIKAPGMIGGILWFLFVMIGLYLILPFLNPDIFSNQKKMMIYLSLWFVASIVFDLRRWNDELLGATFKTKVDLFYYFGGFLGYLLLGNYLHHKYYQKTNLNKRKLYLIIFILFISSIIFKKVFSTNNFLSFTSIMITISIFLFLQQIKLNTQSKYYRVLKKISELSFGIYLSHMVIYKCITEDIYYQIGSEWYIQISVIVLTFISAYLFTLLLSKLPFRKYIIG